MIELEIMSHDRASRLRRKNSDMVAKKQERAAVYEPTISIDEKSRVPLGTRLFKK